MKIDKVVGGHVPQTSFNQASKTQTETKTSPTTKGESTINANTAAIDKAQIEMASLADVDLDKVEQVRNALNRGELTLDTKALSQAVLQFHTGHE